MALILGCVRKIARRDREVKSGQWNIGRRDPIYRLRDKVVGIAGYGNIPRVLHRKIRGFGPSKVLICDPFVDDKIICGAGGEKVDLDTLLGESDIISCHVPLSKRTRHMFDAEAFRKMKNTAIFVNTSRGGLVDTRALYEALKSGEINSAGIDVHEQEPVPKNYSLFELDNVILTDHAGWYSEESQVDLQIKAAKGVVDVLSGRKPASVVNGEVLK
jgi:D-3-phosphoglycerate dehydrogenase